MLFTPIYVYVKTDPFEIVLLAKETAKGERMAELGKKAQSDLRRINDLFARQEYYHGEWKIYEDYFRGRYSDKQWRKLKKTKRSRLFIPVIRNIINIVKSIFTTSFFSAGCPIEVAYIGDSDKDKANVITTLVKYWYEKDKPYKELSRAFWSALTLRLGIVLSYWDGKRIVTREVFIRDIAFDYEANNIDDVQDLAYRLYESGNTIKSKIESGFYKKITVKDFFGNRPEDYSSKRYEVKELIKRDGEKWFCRTFCDGKLLREVSFDRNPFQYGYAMDDYKHQHDDLRKNQILVYGMSMVSLLKEIQDEINIKRNQKNDIQEEKINPSWIVDETVTVNPFDLKKGAGTHIKVSGKLSGMMIKPTPSEIDLNNDLSILTKQDLEDASGVNGIMRGGTSASDRRSAAALSIVNSNSSPRIEDMILLISDTLFHHWAKNFVYLAIKHSSDDLIHRLTERDDYPIGRMGERSVGDYDVRISFGSTINKEAKVNDLMNITQMLLQNPKANPAVVDRMFEEIITLKLGENTKLSEVFMAEGSLLPEMQEEPQMPQEMIDPELEREKALIAAGSL